MSVSIDTILAVWELALKDFFIFVVGSCFGMMLIGRR